MMIEVKSVYEFYQIRGKTWPNAPDVNVILGEGVTQEGNKWVFDVTSQTGADLTIELGSQTWGLSSNEISHYNIQFQGSTQTTDDAEVLIVVSSGDYYFSQMLSLDTASTQYQECPADNSPLLETNVNTMINSATPDRYDRFCDNNNWNDQGFDDAGLWPMGFYLYSDPTLNTLDYSWYHDFIDDDELIDTSSHYTSTFPSDQGLKIYISGNTAGQSFTITRINLFYQTYTIPTPEPTLNPTTATPTSTAATPSPVLVQALGVEIGGDISTTEQESHALQYKPFFVGLVLFLCVVIF